MRILALVLGCSVLLSAMPAHAEEGGGPGEGEGEGEGESKVPALIGTGVTAAFVITSVVSYFEYQAALKERRDKLGAQREEWYQAADDAARWHDIGLYSVGAAIIAGGITGYLWTRTEKAPRHFRVTAAPSGAAAWLSGSF